MKKKALAVASVLMGIGLGFAPWALHVTTNHLAFLALALDGSAMVLFGFAVFHRG